MKNKLLVIMGILLLVTTIVTSQGSFIFQQFKQVDLNVPVFHNNRSKADSTVSCFLTARYPNTSVFINDSLMSYSSTGYYNYTINPEYTNIIGDYPASIRCDNTADFGFTSFSFTITPSGQQDINEGQGFSLFGSLIVMLVIAIVFFILSSNSTNPIFKVIFIAISGIILLTSVLFALVILTQNLGGFTNLVESYSAFWMVIRVLAFILISALVFYGFIVGIRAWKIKRGFLD